MVCMHCQTQPRSLPEHGLLYLAAPLAFTLDKIRAHLRTVGLAFAEPHPDTITVPLVADTLQALSVGLRDVLSTVELRDVQVVVAAGGGLPVIPEFMGGRSLSTFLAAVEGEWLSAMLRESRLVTHFQPIVHATSPATVFAYECLVRGAEADGSLVYPDRMFGVAHEADLLYMLDRVARTTAIRSAVTAGITEKLFINFVPGAIYDPASCLRTTVRAIELSPFTPDGVVFEVVESEQTADIAHLLRILDYYRAAGFGVALDDMGSGYNSLNLLGKLQPDYVKLDRDAIRAVDSDPYRGQIVAKLLELARTLRVATIAEGVETEGEWQWLRDHGVDYVQGYLFGRPAATPRLPVQGGDGHTHEETVRREDQVISAATHEGHAP